MTQNCDHDTSLSHLVASHEISPVLSPVTLSTKDCRRSHDAKYYPSGYAAGNPAQKPKASRSQSTKNQKPPNKLLREEETKGKETRSHPFTSFPHRKCSLQRVAQVLGDFVHADTTHGSNCECSNEGVRILRVLQS